MYGIKESTICIAGKNQCAIDALKYLLKIKNLNIVSLPNKSDNGKDSWQKSFKKFSIKKNIKIYKLEQLYEINNLYLFSFEYENLLKVNLQNSLKYENINLIVDQITHWEILTS